MLWNSGKGVEVTMTSQWVPTMMQHHENGKIQSFSCSYCTNMGSEKTMTREDTPLCVTMWFLVVYVINMSVQFVLSISLLFTENKRSLKHESFANHCHHGL